MPIEHYDPDLPPAPPEWLGLGEEQRLALVLAHHSESATPQAKARLHAAIHVVVENQLALGDPAVVAETLRRLQREGLSRHDSIHAIGTAVSQLLVELSNAPAADRSAAMQRYGEALARLTAKGFVRDPEP